MGRDVLTFILGAMWGSIREEGVHKLFFVASLDESKYGVFGGNAETIKRNGENQSAGMGGGGFGPGRARS